MFTRPSFSGDSLEEIAEEATIPADEPIVKRSGFGPFSEKMQVRDHGAAKLYVAVGEDVEDGKSCLVWAARNFLQAGDLKLVLLHVHDPALRIMTGSIHTAYRKFRKEETNTPLNQYLDFCRFSLKIQAETLVVEETCPANGIIDLIDQHHITSLVMGASSNSPQRKAPSSEVAGSVHLQAKPYCQIFYICNEALACTREATRLYEKIVIPQRCVSDEPEFSSLSEMISDSEEKVSASTRRWLADTTSSTCFSLNSSQHSAGVSSGFSLNSTEASLVPVSVASSEEHQYSLVETHIRHDVFEQLQRVRNELERVRKEASESQQKIERDLFEGSMMLKARESSLRKEKVVVEERLTKEKSFLEKEYIRMHKELQKSNEQRSELKKKLVQANSLLQREKEHSARQAAQIHLMHDSNTVSSSTGTVDLTEFSYEEINEATDNFGDSKKIGQGGCGSVYKGFLRRTAVAIKKVNLNGAAGEKEFNDEVEILCKMRHPNLVTLIGVCREAKALVFELLSNGSLEDCLECKHPERKPLSWRTRIRIASGICTGLIYLHSSKPKGIVHGDLKPANVLLDANFVCKLADFGISRPLDLTNTSATAYHHTSQIKGTMGYMDPVYIASGELTAQYDVYSFGVVLLRLLTGKNPLRLPNKVQSALRNDRLQDMVDASAGDWPTEYAHVLARLALRCCRYERKERPDLAKEAWGVLQAIINDTESSLEIMPATNVSRLPNDTGDHEGTTRCCGWIC